MCILGLIVALFQRSVRVYRPQRQIRPELQPCVKAQPDLKVRGGLDLSTLDRLSPKLIIYTARFLSPDSAASFALCCHSIYAVLGTRYWESLRTQDQQEQRMAFLTLLERDLPEYIIFHPCRILHLPQKESAATQVYQLRQEIQDIIKLCDHEQYKGGTSEFIHIHFYFSNFQMAMKRHRLGLPYSDYLIMLGTWDQGTVDELPYQTRALAKIVDKSLILRRRSALLIPLGRTIQIPVYAYMGICPHTRTRDLNVRVLQDVRCRVEHNHHLGQCSKSSGLKQCCYCPTEYQVDLQECGPRGVLVVITKWLDLGEGRTWTDSKWRSHLANMEPYQTGTADMATYLREVGSIRNLFEQNEHRGFDLFFSPEDVDELCRLSWGLVNHINYGGSVQVNYGAAAQVNYGGTAQVNYGGTVEVNYGGLVQVNYGGAVRFNGGGSVQVNYNT